MCVCVCRSALLFSAAAHSPSVSLFPLFLLLLFSSPLLSSTIRPVRVVSSLVSGGLIPFTSCLPLRKPTSSPSPPLLSSPPSCPRTRFFLCCRCTSRSASSLQPRLEICSSHYHAHRSSHVRPRLVSDPGSSCQPTVIWPPSLPPPSSPCLSTVAVAVRRQHQQQAAEVRVVHWTRSTCQCHHSDWLLPRLGTVRPP